MFNVLGGMVNFIGGVVNFVGLGTVQSVAGAAAVVLAWKFGSYIWEHLKPLEPVCDFARKKAYNGGKNTRDFLVKRIPDRNFRDARLQELADDSESIQDAFVRGILGQPY